PRRRWGGSPSTSCCLSRSSNARSSGNASATRSPLPRRKGCGWAASPRSATRSRIASWWFLSSETETVRRIFYRYRALGSVRRLKEDLDEEGIRSKQRVDRDGRRAGGQP